MNYKVTSKKWRPKVFSEVIGQKNIVRILKNSIHSNRIANAYLFVGPHGTGKTSLARIFSKALNCENGPSVNYDTNHSTCIDISNGSCMDVIEIDGASNNSVDQIRELRSSCQYYPINCRFKIYIIDEVHMLSIPAFNALLKTLEEPPDHVKFILATTESSKIPLTIISRCQRLSFNRISEGEIFNQLKFITSKERVFISDNVLHSISYMSHGSIRDSQSILDQLITCCGSSINESDMVGVFGFAPLSVLESIVQSIIKADYVSIKNESSYLVSLNCNLFHVLIDLQKLIHCYLINIIRNKEKDPYCGILCSESCIRIIDILNEGVGSIHNGLSEQINFEVTLFKAIEQSRSRAIDTVINKLKDLIDG